MAQEIGCDLRAASLRSSAGGTPFGQGGSPDGAELRV
jgi:hypothetical protein